MPARMKLTARSQSDATCADRIDGISDTYAFMFGATPEAASLKATAASPAASSAERRPLSGQAEEAGCH